MLIVDGVEQEHGAAGVLSRLLEAAPGLRILATGRESLQLEGEMVMALAPLAVPTAGEDDPAVLEAVPSVALFVERARSAEPGFTLSAADAPAIAELCRRLDGLPLAVELAAARRIPLGGPERLLESLERAGGALDWTLSLLAEEERDLFAGLGVFAEAWTIEQLDRMSDGDAFAALIDASLVRVRGDGRFAMAETVREHARSLLAEQGRADELRGRHARVLAEDAEAIHDELLLDVGTQAARAVELMREFAAALGWSAAHDVPTHRRLVAALGVPYYFAGRLSALADDVVALAAGDERADDVSARLLLSWAVVLASRADMAGGAFAAAGAAACLRRLGDERGEVLAVAIEAHMRAFAGSGGTARARQLLDAALLLPAARADPGLEHVLRGEIAITLVEAGEVDEAEPMLAEMIADPGRTDFTTGFAWSYWADCALARGNYDAALERYAETLWRFRAMQLHNVLVQCFSIATALAGLGRDAEAIELMAAVQAVGERDGTVNLPEELRPESVPLAAAATERLGEPAVAEARSRGRARTLDDIVAWAVSLGGRPSGGT